ncbi:MAG: SsrA-binding protein SmpB [Bacteroidetes bacterium]|nr:SsrA-binding protein SmpB [Bacteroidota bacterium]
MPKLSNSVNIENRRAKFDYAFIERYTAGLILKGTEIKSIREGKVNLGDSYCVFENGELLVRNMHITEYSEASFYSHTPIRDRKLLLNKTELNKLEKKLKDKGLAIIPVRMFISESGYAKLDIALAKGKKEFDKREDIKKRDIERDLSRKF